jgi:hypothetical protein
MDQSIKTDCQYYRAEKKKGLSLTVSAFKSIAEESYKRIGDDIGESGDE